MVATLVLVLDTAQGLDMGLGQDMALEADMEPAQELDMLGLGLDMLDMEQEQGGMDMCEDMVHAMVQDMERDMVLDGPLDRTRRCLHSSPPYSIWYGHLCSRSDRKHSR